MEKYLNLIRANADVSPFSRFPMAACIVCKGEVISCETNHIKTHPMQAKYASKPERIHLHAEIATLVRARWPREDNVSGGHMYVGRLLKNGSWGSSKPCKGCFAAILHSGISQITFFEDNLYIGEWVTYNLRTPELGVVRKYVSN